MSQQAVPMNIPSDADLAMALYIFMASRLHSYSILRWTCQR